MIVGSSLPFRALVLQGKAQGTCDRSGVSRGLGQLWVRAVVEAGKVPGVSERVAGRGEVASCGAVRCTSASGEGE